VRGSSPALRRHVACNAILGSSFDTRITLNAALANTNNQSTFGSPRQQATYHEPLRTAR
jgi:hypothetical protein